VLVVLTFTNSVILLVSQVVCWAPKQMVKLKRMNVSLYPFFTLSECHVWSAGAYLCLFWAVDHVVTFPMNAALVTIQRQHRAWSFPLHHPLPITRLDRPQVPFFMSSFALTRPGFEPSLACALHP